ncbi:hypothetical protein EV363DRAFT_1321520 [Boletus edulis]|nr:hypothetical protein EV363DRAFT_1321520 [Boletus edulis]
MLTHRGIQPKARVLVLKHSSLLQLSSQSVTAQCSVRSLSLVAVLITYPRMPIWAPPHSPPWLNAHHNHHGRWLITKYITPTVRSSGTPNIHDITPHDPLQPCRHRYSSLVHSELPLLVTHHQVKHVTSQCAYDHRIRHFHQPYSFLPGNPAVLRLCTHSCNALLVQFCPVWHTSYPPDRDFRLI